jgi:hypothetical protein
MDEFERALQNAADEEQRIQRERDPFADEQRINAETDELLFRMAARRETIERQSSSRDLIYKEHTTPLPQSRRCAEEDYTDRNPQPPVDDMNNATRWVHWFIDAFDLRMDGYVKAMVDDISARFDQIEEQIASLEARVDALEDGGNGDARRVLSLPKLQLRGGRRHDAA